MQKYFEELRHSLIELMKELFINKKFDHYYAIDFDSIHGSNHYIRFYRILEEMNIICLNQANDDVKRCHKQAFKVYKAYIVGMELLGNNLNMLEDLISFSRIFIRRPDNKSSDISPLVDSILKDRRVSRHYICASERNYTYRYLMLKHYYTFCELLFELDLYLKQEFMSEKEWNTNMQEITSICNEIKLFLQKLYVEVIRNPFFEVKCVLLKVIVELKDCIYKSIDMKSHCIFDTLQLGSYDGMPDIPSFSNKETSCRGVVKAKDYYDALDNIKKQVAENKIKYRREFILKRFLVLRKIKYHRPLSKMNVYPLI